MERTVENLKEMIRAGRGKIPAHKVIRGGMLVNVMSSEIYPADIAVYEDMIVRSAMWKSTLGRTQKSLMRRADIWCRE